MDIKMMTLLGLTGLSVAGSLSAEIVPRCLASVPGNLSEIVKNFEGQISDDQSSEIVPRCLASVPTEISEILKQFEGQILTQDKINMVEKLIEHKFDQGLDSTPAE